jgi:Ca2+-binding RTX toxin-like protein
VRAFVDRAGNLTVRGDRFANVLTVRSSGEAPEGALRLEGESGTTVNGQTEVGVLATGRIRVLLGRGDDVLRIEAEIPGDVTIRTGAGNDRVERFGGEVRGELRIEAGAGDDVVTSNGPYHRRLVRIDGGSGDDFIGTFPFSCYDDSLVIDGGPGADSVAVDPPSNLLVLPCGVRGDLAVETRAGADQVSIASRVDGALGVALGAQDDRLDLCAVVGGPALLSGGAGSDLLADGGASTFLAGAPEIGGFESSGSASCLIFVGLQDEPRPSRPGSGPPGDLVGR